MILRSLVQLANDEGLVGDAGFEQRHVPWLIDVLEDGTIAGIHGPELNEKRKPVSRTLTIPCVNMNKGSGKDPDSLVEKAEFAFGITSKKPEDAATKHRNMVAFVRAFAEATGNEPGLLAMLRCLERYGRDPAALCREWNRANPGATKEVLSQGSDGLLISESFFKNESALIAFRLSGDLVCRRPAVIAEVSRRAIATTADTRTGICSVTGRHGPLCDSHPDFALVSTPGLPVVSFNTEHQAFQHLNRESLENAPISVDAATKIGEALRRLVARDGFRKPGTEIILPRRNWPLTSDTYALYWCESRPNEPDPLDGGWFTTLTEPDAATPEQVEQCFRHPYRDGVPLEMDPRPFHLLVLSRAKSRVVLRRAETSALCEVVRSVRQWWDEISITPRSPTDRLNLGLGYLAKAVKSQVSEAEPPADLNARLYACALNDRLQIPGEMIALIIRRIRSHDDGPNDYHPHDNTVSTARVALLKLALNRAHRLTPKNSPIIKEFAVTLDPAHPHPAYQLGRLFAVLERVQGEAINDLNASICDRFLGQALAAPALVFPRLMKLSHHHLGKIAAENAGRRVNLDKLVDEIVGRLDKQFPRTQPLNDQGIFIIGYHHQRAAFFAKKDAAAPAVTHA